MKPVSDLQSEIGTWAKRNFGDNLGKDQLHPSYGHPLGSLCPLLGIMGELGELVQEQLKALQGRSKLSEGGLWAAKADAVADLMIFLLDYCEREGINLQSVLQNTWDKVGQRKAATYNEDKSREGLLSAKLQCGLEGHAWIAVKGMEATMKVCPRCGDREEIVG